MLAYLVNLPSGPEYLTESAYQLYRSTRPNLPNQKPVQLPPGARIISLIDLTRSEPWTS